MFVPNLFSNVEAFLGKTTIEENEAFQIPGMNGSFMAFYIAGDSMSPTLLRGDMVICTAIEDLLELCDGDLYAVMVGNEVYVRRIRRVVDYFGSITHLQLYVDNNNQYAYVNIELKKISRVLKVRNKMSTIND